MPRIHLPSAARRVPSFQAVLCRAGDGAIRTTPHPVRGRVLQWTLTRRGRTLLGQCRRHAMALERRLTTGLGAEARATVRGWLSKIAAELSQDGWFLTLHDFCRGPLDAA